MLITVIESAPLYAALKIICNRTSASPGEIDNTGVKAPLPGEKELTD
jgi:hypothetical protein